MSLLNKIFNITKYNPLNDDLIREYNDHRNYGPKKILCYAPFNMMYFSSNGDVIACCHNRNNVLGQYPKQSIKKIWFGTKIKTLRNYIKNNDLNYGCNVCKEHIVSKNFAAVKSKMYDYCHAIKNNYPSVMEFELDNTCNLECIMCTGTFSSSIRKNRDKMPPLPIHYDNKFVNQLEEFIPYLEEAKFYGGEPFIIKIYYDIWEKMIELNPAIKFMVQTNGTVLNDKIKSILNKGFFNINISVDSIDKNNYESIRRNAKYEQFIENFYYFYNYCKEKNTYFHVTPTPIRQNWFDIPALIQFCNKLQVPVYFNTLFYPLKNAIWNLESDKILEIYDTLSKANLSKNTEIEKRNSIVLSDFLNQLIAWKNDNIIRSKDKPKNLMLLLEKLNEAKDEYINNLHIRLAKEFKKNHNKASQKIEHYEMLPISKIENKLPSQFHNLIYYELNKLKMIDMIYVLDNDKFEEIVVNTMNTYNEIENNYYCLSLNKEM